MTFVLMFLSFNFLLTNIAIFPQIASEDTIRKLEEKHDMHVQKEVIFFLEIT